MNRNKNNVFMDRRLGQNDKGVDESQKMDLRRVDEVKKVMSKVRMSFLNSLMDHPFYVVHLIYLVVEQQL